MNRRKFLKLAGLGGLGAMLAGAGYGGVRDLISRTAPMLDKPNILILMTDEQRAVRDWPAGWADANLPSLGRRRAHGINFNSAFANACECSPSRSLFLTSTYAPVNRATLTPATLNPAPPNLATIFGAAGYEVVYKGKWHLAAPFVTPFSADSPQDISDIIANDEALQTTYSFSGWNSPDAGTSLTQPASLGGGFGGCGRVWEVVHSEPRPSGALTVERATQRAGRIDFLWRRGRGLYQLSGAGASIRPQRVIRSTPNSGVAGRARNLLP